MRLKRLGKRLLFPGLDLNTRCRYRHLPQHFRKNLYDLISIDQQFDQIICSETLEHVRQDALIIRHFHGILRPGGVLHLCSPFALHPRHHHGRVDNPEDGGHVRDGYTLESYQALLQPVGFEIVKQVGLGLALPLFLLTWALQLLDLPNPKVPFSLYVQAVKSSVERGLV